MMINNIIIEVAEEPSDIPGLRYLPKILNFGASANKEDKLSFTFGYSVEVSAKNYALVEKLAKKYGFGGIIEIGVNRNNDHSFTQALIKNKARNSVYLGIDIEDKSYLNDKDNNVFTIKANSFDHEKITSFRSEIGLKEISILLIDGWHSVDTVLNDWKYSSLLVNGGIVIFHDTNYHPGPALILPAIDKKLYMVEKYFTEDPGDCGMAVAYQGLEKY